MWCVCGVCRHVRYVCVERGIQILSVECVRSRSETAFHYEEIYGTFTHTHTHTHTYIHTLTRIGTSRIPVG